MLHLFCLQAPTVTLERFLEAMAQAVDKQKEEKANLVNGVWASTGWLTKPQTQAFKVLDQLIWQVLTKTALFNSLFR